jgi:hypothetical protein
MPWNLGCRVRSSAGAIIAAALFSGMLLVVPQERAPVAQEQGFTFGLIGDLGYFPEHEPWVDNVFADLNKEPALAFVAHVGDLSRPVFGCTDAMVARRLAQFNASIHPLVYTPGDNEGPTATTRKALREEIRRIGSPSCALSSLRASRASARRNWR